MGNTTTTPEESQNPYGIQTSDPLVQRAIAYLQGLGAPVPTASDQLVTYPGGSYYYSSLTWSDGKGHTSTQTAGVVGDYPNLAANVLAEDGIIILANPLYNVPVPAVNTDLFPPPPPPPNTPATPISPIGPRINPSAPDQVGAQYYEVPSFHLSIGQVWMDLATGQQYTLSGSVGPFGQEVYWVRTK
jgi:hypothetical protein